MERDADPSSPRQWACPSHNLGALGYSHAHSVLMRDAHQLIRAARSLQQQTLEIVNKTNQLLQRVEQRR